MNRPVSTKLMPTATSSRIDFGMMAGCVAAIVVGNLILLYPQLFPSARARSLKELRDAVDQKLPDLKKRVEEHLAAYANDPEACFIAAEQAMHDYDHDKSIEYFRRLPDDAGHWKLQRELGIAKCCRIQGRMYEEEDHLQNVLSLDPLHRDANNRLGHLLQVQGRTWESVAPLMMQIRRGKCRGDELMAVAGSELFFRNDPELEKRSLESRSGKAGIALLGKARTLIFQNRNAEAEQVLRQVIAATPGLGEAQGRLGRMIVEQGNPEEYLDWRGSLPDAARNHPEVWFVQGLKARRIGQTEGAVHCFLKAIRLSPNHLPANVQIAGCLKAMGNSEAAQVFEQRAAQLSELETMLTVLRSDVDPQLMWKAADRLGQLGRYWEAAGWLYVAKQLIPIPGAPVLPADNRWARLAIKDPEQHSTIEELIAPLNIDQFSEPDWGSQVSGARKDVPSERVPSFAPVEWKFDDEAGEAGIRFQYFEGTTEETRLEHIFNVVGGGMAVIDFDLDSWPDLHIAQANDWRKGMDQPVKLDCIYRNKNGIQFQDVTTVSGVSEPGFSHGVCAGDFDQDGFPDLYVSNLGANRLFHNNGDGTFEDVTSQAGVAGEEWSVTSVLADFNGDGLPDLYVGNYSNRDETTQKICHHSSGEQMACTPDTLTAESDRLYLNPGDGRFRDVTDVSGIRESTGRALALIAWDFTGNGRTSLFVANDTSANFLFHNLRTSPEGVPEFSEEGVVLGLAFDADGNAQASMGVAAGDANGDGRLDLFITNFQNESNTFYSQSPDGFYQDFTRRYGLRDSGFKMLGFGTQFVDCDGDGWDDLVAVNGHVDKGRDKDVRDRMQPQLFKNLQGESFAEVAPESIGPFFQKESLGRGLATLDWNGDGRMDFAASHLHAPFSLVTNRTQHSGHSISVRLVSKSGVRNGNGAIVRAKIGGRDRFRLCIAGGGYMTTNSETMQFFLKEEERLEELEVIWGSGNVQKWLSPEVSRELILVEGRELPISVSR